MLQYTDPICYQIVKKLLQLVTSVVQVFSCRHKLIVKAIRPGFHWRHTQNHNDLGVSAQLALHYQMKSSYFPSTKD